MSALKEFANFITLNMASLAETYGQLLAQSNAGYRLFSVESRESSARRLLKAVIEACDTQTADPLLQLFSKTDIQRWTEHITPPNPLAEIECLGQTLTPVVTNLEAGKFLWDILFQLRASVLSQPQAAHAPQPPKTESKPEPADMPIEVELFRGGPITIFRWVNQEDWPMVYVSPTITRFGYQPDDLLSGKITYSEIIYSEDLDRVNAEVEANVKAGLTAYQQEYRIVKANGEVCWIRDFTVVGRNPQGEVTHFDGYIIDTTEQKQLEQQIQESLERRAQQVQTSTEVAQEIAAAPALDDLFQRVVNLVKKRFGYYHAHLYTLQEILVSEGQARDNYLVMQEGTGPAGQKMKEAGHKIALSAPKSLVARAARSGHPVLAPNVANEPDWLPNKLLPDTQSELAVPIKLQDRVLGVLDVQSVEVAGLTEEDQLLLMGLCGQIAVAINNHQIEAERQRTQTILLESEQKYRELINGLPVGVYRNTGPEGRFVEANAAIAAMFEADSVEEFLKHNVIELYRSPADREVFSQKIRRFGFVKDEELQLKTLKGREIWGSVSAVLKKDAGGQTYFEGIIEDITERKKAEIELGQSEEFLNKIIDSIPDPIFVKDEQHRFLILNSAFCNFIGHPREALLGKSDYDFFPKEEADVFWEKDELVMTTGRENINEEAITDALGQRHIISTKKTVFTNAAGRKILVGIISDITDLKAAQEEAQRRARREQTIREVTEKMRAATSLPELVKTAAVELGQKLSAGHAVIELGLLEDDVDSLSSQNGKNQE